MSQTGQKNFLMIIKSFEKHIQRIGDITETFFKDCNLATFAVKQKQHLKRNKMAYQQSDIAMVV